MDKTTKLIVTIFMDNINPKTVELHRRVTSLLNPGYPMVYSKTKLSHAETMDHMWKAEALKKFDSILFLDIDAVPLFHQYFDYMFTAADRGMLAGNAQSSNHINGGKHVFAAPSNVCLSRKTYEKLGSPSANPTARGDVAEEYTWRAEEVGVEVNLLKPISWDKPVNRMAWETDKSPTWKLPDGTEYGIGTTFAYIAVDTGFEVPLVWHCFQSFHEGHQELLWKKIEDVIVIQESMAKRGVE